MRDPFFLFGSQGSFSLFQVGYGALSRLIGLDHAALVIALAGGMTWVTGNALLVNRLRLRPYWFVFALLATSVMSVNYSPNAATFVLNESFPTARSVAFPLGLIALAISLGARQWLAFAAAFFCFVLHPLIGVWVLATLIAARQADRGVLLLAAICLGLLSVLVGLGIGPFHVIDPEWESLARASSIDLFVGAVGSARINPVLVALGLVLIAAECVDIRGQRMFQVASLIGATGFLLAQIAAYYVPSVLLVQAQTWRAMWIAYALSVPACFVLANALWHHRAGVPATAIALALYALSAWAGYLLVGLWVALKLFGCHRAVRLASFAVRWTIYWRILCFLLALVLLPGLLNDIEMSGRSIPLSLQSGDAFADGLVLAGGCGLGLALWSGIAIRWPRVFSALSVAMFVLAISHWDQRTPNYRDWERAVGASNRLGSERITEGDVVYWIGAPSHRVWAELRTANYASADQLIGGIFSREKTFELLRRRQRLAVASMATEWPLNDAAARRLMAHYQLQSGDTLDTFGNLFLSYSRARKITGHGLLYLCEDEDLDWVISSETLAQSAIPPLAGVVSGSPIWLYDCRPFRRSLRREGIQLRGSGS